MQPKNTIWNYLLFFACTTLVLIGTVYLQNRLRPKDETSTAQVQREALQWGDVVARSLGSAAAPGVPGLGSAAQAYVDAKTGDWLAQRSYSLPLLAQDQPKPPAPPKERPAPALVNAKHEEIHLGNDESNLKVVVTSLGAGVQSVILNQFQAATVEGQPAPDGAREELIPASVNRDDPSDVVVAYARPEDSHPQPELAKLNWTVESKKLDDANKHWEVTFAADVPDQDVRILKTYTLNQDDYHIGLKVELRRRGQSKEPIKFRYQLVGAHGLPIEGEWYTSIFRNALIGYGKNNDFWRDYKDSRTIGSAKIVPNEEQGADRVTKGQDITIRYAAIAVQYFVSAVVADNDQAKQDFIEWVRPVVVGEPNLKKPYLDDITVKLTSEPIELKADGPPVVHKYLLYNGPVKVRLLDDAGSGSNAVPSAVVNHYLYDLHLDTLTDYQSPGWFGSFSGAIGWSFLLIKVTNFMHVVLGYLHLLVPNYGLCIILLTLLVRGLMHPVSRKQAKTSIKMQAVMPELKQLQEKHKNDKQALAVAQMELYRRHGVSPVGSCWVVLLQMPIFLGLYYSLQESIHFRLAPFAWIKNLAAPDMLFWWGQSIPWLTDPASQGSMFYLGPYFSLLPVIAVTLMIVQQKFLMPPPTDETQEMQQKMMKYMMIFFGLMFYKVAAGLCLYFIVSSLWGLAERQLLPKAKPGSRAQAASGAAPPLPNRGDGRGGSSGRGARNRPRPGGPKNGEGNGTLKKVQGMWEELLKQAKKK